MPADVLHLIFPYVWSAMILIAFLNHRKGSGDGHLQLRIARLEVQVKALMKELNLTPPVDPMDNEARLLAQTGKGIEAIKLVRTRTGMGLKDAKAYVEALNTTI